jgi:hypothetical protein
MLKLTNSHARYIMTTLYHTLALCTVSTMFRHNHWFLVSELK